MIKGITPRVYQETILNTASNHNTLVVLPTGLGKTLVALMLAVQRISSFPNSKIVFVSPTRPLVQQHFKTFSNHLEINPELLALFTGSVTPKKRKALWDSSQIIFSTPQGFENDIIGGKLLLDEVSLIIFDEAHRAVGDYAYVTIAKQYAKKAKYPHILALTASPGAQKDKILEVCQNLAIDRVEIRTQKDPDVKPYIQETEITFVEVDFPEEFKRLQKIIDECTKSKLQAVKELGYLNSVQINKLELLKLMRQLQGMLARGERDFSVMKSISLLAEAMKIQHAQELLETQGLSQTLSYLKKIDEQGQTSKTKALRNLVKDVKFRQALIIAKSLSNTDISHPKFAKLIELVGEDISSNQDSKVIVFCQYRDSAEKIKEVLDANSFNSKVFVGQTKKDGKGMSQKQQIETINEFKLGLFQVLICTSVAEEGLDIPRVDSVIFFEPVPSAIRTIQRRGRTGRQEKGKVMMLVTKGTRDVGYRWSAHHKEKRMYRILNELRDSLPKELARLRGENQEDSSTTTLHSFIGKQPSQKTITKDQTPVKIICDYREKGSAVMKSLLQKEIQLDLQQLPAADYILSDRVGVEFKSMGDFVQSIIDGRLLDQAKSLRRSFSRPMIIIEGDQDMYSLRRIHPNAIQGMIATLLVSFGIPLINTKTPQETANLLSIMAKREQDLLKKHPEWHGAKRDFLVHEQMEYITGALPGIGSTLAKPLLKEFGSIKKLFTASEEELQNVDLIGPKKAKKIREVIDANYHEELDKKKN